MTESHARETLLRHHSRDSQAAPDGSKAALTVTVLICTRDREDDLYAALRSVDVQWPAPGFRCDVLVVDNGSSDGTPQVVEEAASDLRHPVRYFCERRPGKSRALNLGFRKAQGEFVQVFDDDERMPPGYLKGLADALRRHPEASFVAGKVLPIWGSPPPGWLTREHWSALGMSDYGNETRRIDDDDLICLGTPCFRRRDVLAVGGVDETLDVSEDADLQMHLSRAGYFGMYEPELVLHHRAPASRLTKAYHRFWHCRHGRSRAMIWNPKVEASRLRLIGVPAHMYRRAAGDLVGLMRGMLTKSKITSFRHETRLRFFAGFFRERLGGRLRRHP